MRRVLLAGTLALATLLGPSAAQAVPSAAAADPGRADLVDFNGDDLDDLAVGAPGEDVGTVPDAGAVNTLHGSAAGLAGTGVTLFQGAGGLGDAVEPGDRFGTTLAKGIFSNNFNGDAFDDLAVGVPFERVGDRPGAGLVNLLDGSAADGLVGSGVTLFQGGDAFGGSVG